MNRNVVEGTIIFIFVTILLVAIFRYFLGGI
jgi:hypothetical protein